MAFQYFVAQKQQVVVISFMGDMSKSSMETLEKCLREVENLKIKFAILNFREVQNIDDSSNRLLSLIQSTLRKDGELRLCGLAPDLKRHLCRMAVCRDKEIKNNIIECLESLNLTTSIK